MTGVTETLYFVPADGPRIPPGEAPTVATGEDTVTLLYGDEWRAVLTYATGKVAWFRRSTVEEWKAWYNARVPEPQEVSVSREWLEVLMDNTIRESSRGDLPPSVLDSLSEAAASIGRMMKAMQ